VDVQSYTVCLFGALHLDTAFPVRERAAYAVGLIGRALHPAARERAWFVGPNTRQCPTLDIAENGNGACLRAGFHRVAYYGHSVGMRREPGSIGGFFRFLEECIFCSALPVQNLV
jgi:hypothetical protein